MESLLATGQWTTAALLLGLSATRIATACMLLPLFSSELIPPLVRNAMFIALALLSLVLQPNLDVAHLTSSQWARLFAKELFIGAAIGVLFGSVLWAFDAAGQVIDLKTGASMAQVLDPLSGHQTPLTGAFLSRLAGFVFMFSGGLSLLVGLLLQSHALWPVGQPWAELRPGGAALFEAEFGRLMNLVLLISAPCLLALYVVDGALGLINRFAPQLNVFSLSSSLKTVLANAMLMLTLAGFVQMVMEDIAARPEAVVRTLRQLVGG
jgi:type III secretion protein T